MRKYFYPLERVLNTLTSVETERSSIISKLNQASKATRPHKLCNLIVYSVQNTKKKYEEVIICIEL